MANISKQLSDKELAEVETMAGLGLRFEDIALIKGMSADTLKKYADDYLQCGRAKAKAQVMQTAYKMAVSGKHPAMTMFWLKTRANWRESQPEQAVQLEQEKLVSDVLQANKPAQALVGYLIQTMGQVATGGMDPALAAGISTLASSVMKAAGQGELEDRVQQLELALQCQKPKPLEIDV